MRHSARVTRFGRGVFVAALRLLPRALRDRIGDGMLEVFDERQREAQAAGVLAMLRVWAHELGGAVLVAVQARRRVAKPWKESAAGSGGPRPRPYLPFATMIEDARFAMRAARRRPGPYVMAVLTCALGIGAGTAMFSLVDTVLLRPLPYPDPERIVSVYPTIEEWRDHPTLSAFWDRASWSYPEYVDWRGEQRSFTQAAVYGSSTVTLTGSGEPVRVGVGRASGELFAMLGAAPVLGRGFAEEEGVRGERVVVLTHGFWQSRFGGARDVIGQTVRLSGVARTIVGVLPARFQLTGLDAVAWTPIDGQEVAQRDNHNLRMIARLAPGAGIERAQDETSRILEALTRSHRESETTHRAHLVPRLDDETRQVRTPLLILLAASVLLLAVACVNVAALLLGLGIDREHELIVRGAIGADRGRLVRQLVTESLVLAAAGGAAGVLLALLLTNGLVLLAPAGVPRIDAVRLDGRVLTVALAASCGVGVLFGLLPALALTGADLAGRMRGARSTGRRHRLHAGLVVAQVALATVLLLGAGLLARTLAKLDAVDPGFDPEGVLTVRIAPSYQQFTDGGDFDASRFDQYHAELETALRRVPGVAAVGITSSLPYSGDRAGNGIEPEGYVPSPGEVVVASRYTVSANYMDLMRMRIVEGRGFTAADDRADAAKVTIVTENLARRFWPGESPLGRDITFWGGTFTIVGVVADVRDRSLSEGDDVRYYMPRRQLPGQGGSFVLRAAASIDPLSLASDLRRAVWSVDPAVPVTSVMLLTERIADSLSEQRYRARLMGVFGVLAVLLSTLGIYGVTGSAVASRTREIGVRSALGQPRGGALALVLRQGVMLALAGVAAGLLAGVAAARVLASFLYDTRTADPLTLALVALALTVLAGLASLAPSLRAARIEPIVALRSE
jgi:putative ABC transport system permease protein